MRVSVRSPRCARGLPARERESWVKTRSAGLPGLHCALRGRRALLLRMHSLQAVMKVLRLRLLRSLQLPQLALELGGGGL